MKAYNESNSPVGCSLVLYTFHCMYSVVIDVWQVKLVSLVHNDVVKSTTLRDGTKVSKFDCQMFCSQLKVGADTVEEIFDLFGTCMCIQASQKYA